MATDFERFDTIVVGARCAGAPLATHLARAGQRVLMLDAQKLPSDQPFSTHAIQVKGMDYLDELGCGARIRQLSPAVRTARMSVNGHYLDIRVPEERAIHCPRRLALDPVLLETALAAGAELRDEHAVLDLVRDGDRVVGVKARHGEKTHELRARIVVGADGRSSTIARRVRAEEYLVTAAARGGYWAYFPVTPAWRDEARYPYETIIAIDGIEARMVFQTDSDLLLIGALTEPHVARTWSSAPAASLARELRRHPVTGPLVDGNPAVAPPVGLLKGRFYFKQAAGRGWALVGDAGLHKDPTPGIGITDALRDARALSQAILDASDEALAVYWRRRDVESVPLYFNATDMGSLDFANPLNEVVMSRANRSAEVAARMARVMDRELPPQEMIPPRTALAWTFGALLRGKFGVLPALARGARRAKELAAEMERRKRLYEIAVADLQRRSATR